MTNVDSHDEGQDSAGQPACTAPDVDIQEPDHSLPEIPFDQWPEGLRQAMARAGWNGPTPVQAKSLPYILEDRDLMVQSRTGSGKTGAFVLPILHGVKPALQACQALILVPTRELAKQVATEAETLCGDTLTVASVYGGVGYGRQVEQLQAGAQIVVGTPGRILDHLLRRTFDLEKLSFLVFDEADRMLSIGFYPDMKQVKKYLPRRPVRTLLFSATYPPFVLRLAGEFMREPQMLSLSSRQVHVSAVVHAFCEVPRMGRERALMRLIEMENPASAIIFCNTKAQVEFLAEVLRNFGYDAEGLTGDLSQNRREQLMAKARAGRLRFLVATDVAARGIDIPDLSHVIQYEPPEDPESYIHRAGRTGRAGASGEAITLVDVIQKLELERLARKFQIEFQCRPLPTDEDVQQLMIERQTTLLEAEYRGRPAIKRERIRRFLPLAKELAASEDSLALLAMLLDDNYQASLHSALELPDEMPEPMPEPRPALKPLPRPAPRRPASMETMETSESGGEAAAENGEAPAKRRRRRRRKKPASAETPATSVDEE